MHITSTCSVECCAISCICWAYLEDKHAEVVWVEDHVQAKHLRILKGLHGCPALNGPDPSKFSKFLKFVFKILPIKIWSGTDINRRWSPSKRWDESPPASFAANNYLPPLATCNAAHWRFLEWCHLHGDLLTWQCKICFSKLWSNCSCFINSSVVHLKLIHAWSI